MLPAHLERVALFSGGSEAVESAILLAQRASGRSRILVFERSYHGRTLATRYASGALPVEQKQLGIDWLTTLPYPHCTVHDAVDYGGCEEEGNDILCLLRSELEVGDVAAVLVEPILGTAGNYPPCRRFPGMLSAVCAEHDVTVILDESITGFFRLGVDFGATYFGIEPDILVLGKAMGGGYPLSAIATRAALWERGDYNRPSATSTSFGASPLAAAAGLATLGVLTAGAREWPMAEVSAALVAGLTEIADTTGWISRPRGVGLMLGFDVLVASGADLAVSMAERGVLLAPAGQAIRLQPPLVLTMDEAQAFLARLADALRSLSCD